MPDIFRLLIMGLAVVVLIRLIEREYKPRAQAQREERPTFWLTTTPDGRVVAEPFHWGSRYRRVSTTMHPVLGPAPWHTFLKTVQLHSWLAPLFHQWGRFRLRYTRPPQHLPLLPPGIDRTPLQIILYGSYNAQHKETTLTLYQQPAGWTAFWRPPNMASKWLPLVILEPQVFRLHYRNLNELALIRRFLKAYLHHLGLMGESMDIGSMNLILEKLASTPWARQPFHRPVVAFYLALSRISMAHLLPEDYGLGDFWEPLAPYLRPSLVAGYQILDDQPSAVGVDKELLARMYNLRAYSTTYVAFGMLIPQGIKDLQQALALNPAHPEVYWLNLGSLYAGRGAFAQALEAYATAKGLPPLRPLAAYARAVVYYHLGEIAQARQELQVALADPSESLLGRIRRYLEDTDPDFLVQSKAV